jgi:hypothetical protein
MSPILFKPFSNGHHNGGEDDKKFLQIAETTFSQAVNTLFGANVTNISLLQ